MNSTWVLAPLLTLAGGYIIWLTIASARANCNARNLRPPSYVATDIFAIDWQELWEQGVRVVVLDVDLTLCTMYGNCVSAEVADKLQDLKRMGFKVILASHSNKNLKQIAIQLNGGRGNYRSWLRTISKADKDSRGFYSSVRQRISSSPWDFKIPAYSIAYVGDKLTDMGYSVPHHDQRIIGVLTNPAFGKDLLREILILRRVRESFTLDYWHIERVHGPGEFRRVSALPRKRQHHEVGRIDMAALPAILCLVILVSLSLWLYFRLP